jgi:hypothetical protein
MKRALNPLSIFYHFCPYRLFIPKKALHRNGVNTLFLSPSSSIPNDGL